MSNQLSIVHPELQKIAKRLPHFNLSRRNLWFLRFLDKVLWRRKTPNDVSIQSLYAPRQDDPSQIRLRVYRPKAMSASAPALLWLHGGGFVVGKPEQCDPYCIQYVRELGLVIFAVDYRHAPEYPFPSALNDSYTALEWVKSNAAQLGVDANRIAIGGESAGGGLAAALVQLACDRKEIKPIFQLLVYPMLDDRTSIRTDLIDHGTLTWTQESNRFGWESYLGKECGAEDVPPYSVPARLVDLSALPPAWIGVGTLDLFHDEDIAYAQRLKDCGVACELHIVRGAFHGFDMTVPHSKVVQDFRKSQVAALRKYLLS